MRVNGVDIAPLVEAELDRRDPQRALMRPTDAQGFRHAWEVLDGLWARTVARARALDPALLHVSVADEWSFIETLRHLAFATDSWVGRAILGDPSPWHPLELPWDEMPDTPGVPRDREVRPDLDVVLALRKDRWAMVSTYLAGLTDEALDVDTEPVAGPGWPPPQSFPVRECLLVVLNEEWNHRLFAERDLAVLEAGSAEDGGEEAGASGRATSGRTTSGTAAPRAVARRRADGIRMPWQHDPVAGSSSSLVTTARPS